MKRVLIVKVTSLGDIVHGLPLVSDLHRAYPGIAVDWAADAAFADILRWHPGIDRVLCAPLRRFKKQRSLADFKAIAASIAELRRVKYDAVVDVHGVYKSAIISFLARAKSRYGYRAEYLGERGAAFAYSRRFRRFEGFNAWDGLRKSVSEALGYPLVGGARFDLRLPEQLAVPALAGSRPFAMFFHATSSEQKKWPVANWQAIGRHLLERGVRVALPWGSEAEHASAQAIASGIPGAIVLPRLSIEEVARHIGRSCLVVGTDTGFVHLASAVTKPTVMIFTATSRSHFGVDVPGHARSVGDEGRPADLGEVCEAIAEVCPLDIGPTATLIEGASADPIASASAQKPARRRTGTQHIETFESGIPI